MSSDIERELAEQKSAARIISPLPDFGAEVDLARDFGCNPATLARARKRGCFDYLEWGGRIFVKRVGPRSVDAFLRSKITRRNPPRDSRRRRQPIKVNASP